MTTVSEPTALASAGVVTSLFTPGTLDAARTKDTPLQAAAPLSLIPP